MRVCIQNWAWGSLPRCCKQTTSHHLTRRTRCRWLRPLLGRSTGWSSCSLRTRSRLSSAGRRWQASNAWPSHTSGRPAVSQLLSTLRSFLRFTERMSSSWKWRSLSAYGSSLLSKILTYNLSSRDARFQFLKFAATHVHTRLSLLFSASNPWQTTLSEIARILLSDGLAFDWVR